MNQRASMQPVNPLEHSTILFLKNFSKNSTYKVTRLNNIVHNPVSFKRELCNTDTTTVNPKEDSGAGRKRKIWYRQMSPSLKTQIDQMTV